MISFNTGPAGSRGTNHKSREQARSDGADGPPISVALEFPDDGSSPREGDDSYLVKGILSRGSCGSLIGPPGSAKTTAALDICFSIACGLEHYQGRRVRSAPVLYVGYEGEAGIRDRIAVAYRHHGDPQGRFARLLLPELLCVSEQGLRGEQQIIAAAHKLNERCDEPVGVIVIDTRSRATAGDDEDRNGIAAMFLERLRRITNATGACIVVVHHTGKDASKGGRGASANLGGDDFTLTIRCEAGHLRTISLDKLRDGPDKRDWFSFELEPVELRRDSDGDPITACILRPVEAAAAPEPTRRLTDTQRLALDVLTGLYNDGRTQRIPPSELTGVDVPLVARMKDWRVACRQKQLTTTDDSNPKKKTEAEDKAFQRARDALEVRHYIGAHNGYAWLLGQRGQEGTSGGHVPSGPTRGRTGTPPYRGVLSVPRVLSGGEGDGA